MKPARSSATGRCRSPTPTRRGRRWRRRHDAKRCGAKPNSPRARRRRARRLRAPSAACRSTRARLRPGDLFFAIKGEAHDGHDFVAPRLRGGRRGGGRRPADRAGRSPRSGRLFVVDDTLRALERLARAARARARARVVAVTGSVGKTSAKEMLRVALGALGPTHASAASYNNHWGVPLTLARLPRRRRLRA